MLTRLRVATLFATVLILWQAGAARSEECTALLKDGLYDYRGSQVDQFHYEQFRTWLETHEYETTDQAAADAQKIGFNVFDIFSLDFGGSGSSHRYKDWRKDFLAHSFDEVVDKLSTREFFKTINVPLAQAYSECVKNSTGIFVYIDAADDKQFDVHYLLKPGATDITSVEAAISVSNSDCVSIPTQITTSPQAFHCEKKAVDQTAVVTVAATKFGSPDRSPTFPPFMGHPAGAYRMSAVGYGVGVSKSPIRGVYLLWTDIYGADGTGPTDVVTHDITSALGKFDKIVGWASNQKGEPCSLSPDPAVTRIDDNTVNVRFSFTCRNNFLSFAWRTPKITPFVYAKVQTETPVNSVPVLVSKDVGSQVNEKIKISDNLAPGSEWIDEAFDVRIAPAKGGAEFRLFRDPATNEQKLKDGPFEAIVDSQRDVHIVMSSAAGDLSGLQIPPL